MDRKNVIFNYAVIFELYLSVWKVNTYMKMTFKEAGKIKEKEKEKYSSYEHGRDGSI